VVRFGCSGDLLTTPTLSVEQSCTLPSPYVGKVMTKRTLPRMTLPTLLVLRALTEDPTKERYGLELGAASALPSGTIHPILMRLEKFGLVESRWEDHVDPHEVGRPRRRYYRLTPDGAELARDALARASTSSNGARAVLRPGLAGGA
jgi:PadR family transcriptional regulator PadR